MQAMNLRVSYAAITTEKQFCKNDETYLEISILSYSKKCNLRLFIVRGDGLSEMERPRRH